jgi:hypothetical protein
MVELPADRVDGVNQPLGVKATNAPEGDGANDAVVKNPSRPLQHAVGLPNPMVDDPVEVHDA